MNGSRARIRILGRVAAWVKWAWNPPVSAMIDDHDFVPVDWMPDCAYLPHSQANRCMKPRRYHVT